MHNINTLVEFVIEDIKPELKKGEYAVVALKKSVNKKLNPKTNRQKKFKTNNWIVTNIAPKDRTFKNRPRYANGQVKVKFQDWLEIDAKKRQPSHNALSYGWAANGKCYGYSHRAVFGFKKGSIIKPGDMGNKYQLSKLSDEEYEKAGKFKPYEIKTDKEAEEHAIRFAEAVS